MDISPKRESSETVTTSSQVDTVTRDRATREHNRIEVLDRALRVAEPGEPPEVTIERACAYLDFVDGKRTG